MTRVDELQKKYPSIPKEVIVKWEVVNSGVRDTDDLDKVSDWSGPGTTYQSYDHDVTLKDLAARRPNRLRAGSVLRPRRLHMKNGLYAGTRIDTRSPYGIREVGEGAFALFEGEEKVDVDIYFPNMDAPAMGDVRTSKGTPITQLVSPVGNCFRMMPVRYCEYFATGEQCKFCNFNSTHDDSRSVGIGRAVTINLDEAIEAYRILSADHQLLEGHFEMGGFKSSEHEGSIYVDFIEKIAGAASYKPNLTIIGEALERKDYQRLKDAGLDCITLQMEVWVPELFSEVCPGKAKHMSHERWLDAFFDAVDVFGVGNVGGKIIAGLSLIPENGHKTWQEARDSQIEGNTWMIKNGVFPIFTNLRLPPGSVYWDDKSLREKLPPTDYLLDVAQAHHQASMEYGLYPKLNRFMYCGLECLAGIYAGEIGILALAGDLGNWMADVVPDESNLLAQFVSSVKSPAKV
ncbi:MAG: hypothetical protein Q7O66_04485 [Dehalococcoidia bacterium]|nr:hypothetical protein [Dehalococcoidia bacterium]